MMAIAGGPGCLLSRYGILAAASGCSATQHSSACCLSLNDFVFRAQIRGSDSGVLGDTVGREP